MKADAVAAAFAALTGLAAASALADADTLAFYTFTEGADGESAVGTAILNSVDASRFAGTANVKDNGGGSGKAQFSSDAPAKYIFSGMGGIPIATNAQSIFFNGVLNRTTNDKEGGSVSFEGLATMLSSNSDYTVEFFWKVDTNEVAGVDAYYRSYIYRPSVLWNDGVLAPDGSMSSEGTKCNVPETATGCRIYGGGNDLNKYNEAALYNTYNGYKTDTILDGKWHHFAVTYSRANHLRRTIADYTSLNCNISRNGLNAGITVTNSTMSSSEPLVIGNYGMRGRIACLRVTKRVLGISELLYASNDERFFTDNDETLFHWQCDGESGGAVSVIANRLVPENFHAVNPGLFYFNDSWIVSGLYTGNGTVSVDPSFAGIAPVYTNELPNAKKTLVTDGADRRAGISENAGSIQLSPPSCAARVAFGLDLPSGNFRHFTEGDFTVECFFKFDSAAAAAAGAQTNYPSFTICGAFNAAYSLDWRLFFDFTPRANAADKIGTPAQWDCMRPHFNYYSVSNSTMSGAYSIVATSLRKGTSPWDDDWHHVAVVYEDGEVVGAIKIYLDYEPWFSSTLRGRLTPRTPTAQAFRFGYGLNGFPGPFTYDEVRLVKRALDPDEFLHLARPLRGVQIIFR